MAALIDNEEIGPTQTVDVREGGELWIHDNAAFQDIGLNAQAATRLFDFLLRHMKSIHRHTQAAQRKKEEHDAKH